jgi:hypothetical protein
MTILFSHYRVFVPDRLCSIELAQTNQTNRIDLTERVSTSLLQFRFCREMEKEKRAKSQSQSRERNYISIESSRI